MQQQDRYQLCASKQESKQASCGDAGFTTGRSCTEVAVSGSEGTAADEEQV